MVDTGDTTVGPRVITGTVAGGRFGLAVVPEVQLPGADGAAAPEPEGASSVLGRGQPA